MISSSTRPVCKNHLLGVLPKYEYQELWDNLEPVNMKQGEIIYSPGEPIRYVYFPENCIISMITVFSDGSSVESGIIGREGVAGASVVLSSSNSSREAYVQMSGRGLRIKTDHFRRALGREDLSELILEYSSAFYEQVAQAGACSNHHSSSQRLARLLLMCHDRTEGDKFFITHDSISQMLGMHRPSVTLAAIDFKEKGLIDYSRGFITIADRPGLEQEACECYYTIKQIYNRYNSLLEMRSLNGQMEKVKLEMKVEFQKQPGPAGLSPDHRSHPDLGLNGNNAFAQLFSICESCHQIRSEDGRWHPLDEFLRQRPKVTLCRDVCPACRGKSFAADSGWS